ncbi:MAG TPA: S8 family serine peptidase [Blastocatellia bacterium]|nr:S8 family serine peptidase [Blastocatellia bacterium]
MNTRLILPLALALAAALTAAPPLQSHRVSAAVAVGSSAAQDLEQLQGYLDPAPLGMDVRYAWTLPGGRGENVRIVDIEFNWNRKHNDLAAAAADPVILVRGSDPFPEFNVDHGTAVLGELFAADDGIGVTGIAHRAKLGVINPISDGGSPNVADAINRALAVLERGDVILLEQQSITGPRFNPATGRGLAPVEWDPGVYDAIRTATSRGIVVVEPSANGFENLDHKAYNGAFDRAERDSGAIMVGAGMPPEGVYGPGPDLQRTEESNWGSRVDLQGWGRFVATCGYGDADPDEGKNSRYTTIFGGTSSAAAMVAGAAALIQSIVKARGLAPLTPLRLRRLLVSTATPEGRTSQRVGPRPDLRAAIAALDSPEFAPVPLISRVSYKRSKGRLTVEGEGFVPDDSIIEIDGVAVARHKYPSDFIQPSGFTTRIQTKSNVSAKLPRGVTVSITVFTPSSGKRSAPFLFLNE